MTATRLASFGGTIFAEMTALALEHQAINLSQGFPDFEGPADMVEAAIKALRDGHNQYARSMGALPLVKAIAAQQEELYGLRYDPLTEVIVTTGATEGLAVCLLGLLDPGDEVILLEPFYDTYPPMVTLAGAVPQYCTLRFPDFALDMDELGALFNERTRALILNSPHNPTGKVFDRRELALIAELCQRHDVIVIADEVYEHLTYDDAEHLPIACLPGMRERTLRVSSTGKTYSFTGWKVGWVTGPAPLVAAAQAAHQYTTFSGAHPLQHAVAAGIERHGVDYFTQLRRDYTERRDLLLPVLAEVGFRVAVPTGTYFATADFTGLPQAAGMDDRAFATWLTTVGGVAVIPPSSFYRGDPTEGRRLVRFAFCKELETLTAAAARLRLLP